MLDGKIRLCDRPRWHWDSHAYEITTPFPH
jgi:hypothetical protein